MADSARAIYRPIPPPPLPEFYLRKPAGVASSNSASTSDDGRIFLPSQPRQQELPPARPLPPATVDGVRDAPTYRSYTYTTATKLPPAPFMKPIDTVPPLAVYHICRICLRPRSARYHREHPIPIDGLPPPPGICRRCRISSTSANGSRITTEVMGLQESGEVKLGVKCLIPDDDYVSAKVLRERATERFVQESEYMELESAAEREGDVVYRRVRTCAPQDRPADVVQRSIQIIVPPPPPRSTPRPSAVTSSEAARVTKASNDTTMGQDSPSRLESPTATGPMPIKIASPTERRSTEWGRKFVEEHAEPSRSSRSGYGHRTSIRIEAYKPERTESQIRRLARDEVVRYRQAERMMEHYGSVYTHGKLVEVDQASHEATPGARVPVQRRIALEKDIVDRPWIKSPERPRELEVATAIRQERPQTDREELKEEPRARGHYRERSLTRRALVEDVHIPRPLSRPALGTAVVEDQDANPEHSASSSNSSDKTRWPSESQGMKDPETRRNLVQELLQTEEETVRSRGIAAKSRSQAADARSTNFAAHVQGRRYVDVVSTSSENEIDREYWLDGRPARNAVGRPTRAAEPQDSESLRLVLQRQPMPAEAGPREPVSSSSFDAKHRHMERRSRQKAATEAPPYPAEESITSIQMPSPKSRVSKPNADLPQGDDGEYTYIERTVQNARASSRHGREKPHYEVREIFSQRRRIPKGRPEPDKEVSPTRRRNDSKQRTSDVSSRVRFAKQVEFSPTPPGSEASSTQFRKLGRMRATGGDRGTETGEHIIAEYERRGRPRSRLPSEGYDYR